MKQFLCTLVSKFSKQKDRTQKPLDHEEREKNIALTGFFTYSLIKWEMRVGFFFFFSKEFEMWVLQRNVRRESVGGHMSLFVLCE